LLSGLVLVHYHLHILDSNGFTLGAVERPVASHMPTLKLHSTAGRLRKDVVRTKVATDSVVGREVGESALFRFCSVEVRAIRELSRSQCGLRKQNARLADATQLLPLGHPRGHVAAVGLRNGARDTDHSHRQDQKTSTPHETSPRQQRLRPVPSSKP